MKLDDRREEPMPAAERVKQRALDEAHADWATRLGRASVAALRARLGEALERTDAHEPLVRLRQQLEAEHRARHSSRALRAELEDDRDRDAAASDDAALVAYEAKWRRRLQRLQRVHRGRWRVPGLSEEEVRDQLTLALIEAVRVSPEAEPGRAGKEWGLVVLRGGLRALRRSFRLDTVCASVEDPPLLSLPRSFEEQYLEREADATRDLARERAQRSLSRTQRRWLDAFEQSARAGAIFDASQQPNLSAAARLLGRDRSSAQRAYRELQSRFMREQERL
jgi:hypothetical protein